jgi:hypothetical protein
MLWLSDDWPEAQTLGDIPAESLAEIPQWVKDALAPLGMEPTDPQ